MSQRSFVDSVSRQADRIVGSGAFGSSERLIRLFNYALRESLEGRGAAISQFSIAFDVFGLAGDFDPASNASVRVHASKLRRATKKVRPQETPALLWRVAEPAVAAGANDRGVRGRCG
jgi:hypothetical protein